MPTQKANDCIYSLHTKRLENLKGGNDMSSPIQVDKTNPYMHRNYRTPHISVFVV